MMLRSTGLLIMINENGEFVEANDVGYVHCDHPTSHPNGDPVPRHVVTTMWGRLSHICHLCGQVIKRDLAIDV